MMLPVICITRIWPVEKPKSTMNGDRVVAVFDAKIDGASIEHCALIRKPGGDHFVRAIDRQTEKRLVIAACEKLREAGGQS